MWSKSRRISAVGSPMIIARSSSALYPQIGALVSLTSTSPGSNAMLWAIACAHELRFPIWPR